MESNVNVNEANEVELPESESAPVHRFVRQTSTPPLVESWRERLSNAGPDFEWHCQSSDIP